MVRHKSYLSFNSRITFNKSAVSPTCFLHLLLTYQCLKPNENRSLSIYTINEILKTRPSEPNTLLEMILIICWKLECVASFVWIPEIMKEQYALKKDVSYETMLLQNFFCIKSGIVSLVPDNLVIMFCFSYQNAVMLLLQCKQKVGMW